MNSKAAQLIVDQAYELEVYEDYSGRGMYGEKTAGVTGSLNDFFIAVGEIMQSSGEEDRLIVGEALRDGISTDSMGMDTIIY
jgi:hypothetical protein